MTSLDIDLLRTFVRVADTRSFTDAGDGLGATQSAVSARLKKLEDRLGRRLLDRTPRSVDLTAFGTRFLPDARRILQVHDDALNRALPVRRDLVLRLAVSEHIGSHHLTAVLARLRETLPEARISVTLGLSEMIAAHLAQDACDAALIWRFAGEETSRGVVLRRDPLVWARHPTFAWRKGDPVPLISVARPCRVGAAATARLDQAGIAWHEAFFSAGLAAVRAAVSAGLGIACMGRSSLPDDVTVLGAGDGLPDLPVGEQVLISRTRDPDLGRLLATLGDELAASGGESGIALTRGNGP